MLLSGSLACQPSPTAAEAAALTPQSVIIEHEIEFGPGSLDLPDLRVGLAESSSYESRLTITFDGTRAGQPLEWSGTYTYAAASEPLARQLMIETTGEESGPPVLMLELDGVAYEKPGEDLCMAQVIDPATSAVEELEPAAQLPSLFGAEEAGAEAVNGVQAAHYTFDERALTEAGLNKSTGELWLASEGGHVLRYRQTTTGDENYFGETTQGTMTWDYELTQLNQPVAITLPQDCPPGLVEAPMMPDAANVESLPGLLRYETASSVQDVAAFYKQELLALGWEDFESSFTLPEGMSPEQYQQVLEAMQAMGLGQPGGIGQPTPTPDPNEAYVVFDQGEHRLRVTLTRLETVTQVIISLGRVAPP
jgi:hypothetical protein